MDRKYIVPVLAILVSVFGGITGWVASQSSRITATEERLTAVESRLDEYQRRDSAHRERIERRLDQLTAKIDRDHETVVGMAADLKYTARVLRKLEDGKP